MISDGGREAFVWVWLPGETEPVAAGRLEAGDGAVHFNYGRSYLERVGGRPPAISLYEPELPLRAGALPLPQGLSMPGCIRDAAPDAWGRRVIINMKTGRAGPDADAVILDELRFLLESGSDRIGALDFQRSPFEYAPRAADGAGLEELIESARRVEEGVPLDPERDRALLRGCAVGGARPKALIGGRDGKYVAKFPASADPHSVIKAEFVAMRLARLAGLDAAPVELVRAADRDVLLVERFDRERRDGGWTRRAMVSALTLFALDEMAARHASYETLARIVRHRFSAPKDTLRELFGRLVFNVLCGNTDDHARNHAAFWDGRELSLTPAYDVCPQPRIGGEASQAMRIAGGDARSRLATCIEAAGHFLLSPEEARDICARLTAVVEERFDEVCGEAGLGAAERSLLRERAFLKPWSLEL